MKKKLLLLLLLFSAIYNYAQNQPYVILISFDGFRWDYISRGITPNLEKLANEGVKALSLRPTFPSKTFPNHLSVITGMTPENHGIISNDFEDPFTKDYYRIGSAQAVENPKWYIGEMFWETANRNGIKTASYFWPGSELNIEARRPTYYEKYEHEKPYGERIEGIIEWLKLPYAQRPRFITLYFDATDTYGHDYGPNSYETNNSIKTLDSLVGVLNCKLETIGLIDSVNIIILSDHGMTEISKERIINIEEILNDCKVRFHGIGPVMMIEPENISQTKNIYKILRDNRNNYKAYLKDELPSFYEYDKHPFIHPIIVIADIGWSLIHNNAKNSYVFKSLGNHGYEKDHIDMHGFFVAKGPAFKKGFMTGTLWNIDIYPALCKIFGIIPRSNIDGDIKRIEFILAE